MVNPSMSRWIALDIRTSAICRIDFDMPDAEQLRQTFDQAAELYDRARPGYPPELFDDLAELASTFFTSQCNDHSLRDNNH